MSQKRKMQIFKFIIVKMLQETHNTKYFVLRTEDKLPDVSASMFATIFNGDKSASRPYTPIMRDEHEVSFYIKLYENGVMSQFLAKRDIGDTLEAFCYHEKRVFKPNEFKKVLLVSGGTGIAPMLQLLLEAKALKSPTEFTLINCQRAERDLIGMDLIKTIPNLKVIHFLSNEVREGYRHGPITLEYLRELTKDGDKKVFDFVYVCGTPELYQCICGEKNQALSQGKLSGLLNDLGYTEEEVYKY